MLSYQDVNIKNKLFIFELDDVLYPRKDYFLQVCYLFAHFIEYVEGKEIAAELTEFFKTNYYLSGEQQLFQKAASAFPMVEKYEENFNRLLVQAKLPLKLLLFHEVRSFIEAILKDKKEVALFIKGNPLQEFNKIKQMDWHGLGLQIKTYFYDELMLQGYDHPLTYILADHQKTINEVLIIGKAKESSYDKAMAYFCVDLLFPKK